MTEPLVEQSKTERCTTPGCSVCQPRDCETNEVRDHLFDDSDEVMVAGGDGWSPDEYGWQSGL